MRSRSLNLQYVHILHHSSIFPIGNVIATLRWLQNSSFWGWNFVPQTLGHSSPYDEMVKSNFIPVWRDNFSIWCFLTFLTHKCFFIFVALFKLLQKVQVKRSKITPGNVNYHKVLRNWRTILFFIQGVCYLNNFEADTFTNDLTDRQVFIGIFLLHWPKVHLLCVTISDFKIILEFSFKLLFGFFRT